MRTRLLAALCTAPLLAPVASARAQDAGETDSMDVADAPSPEQDVPAVPGAVTMAPGQVHTVVDGDTLWDLSQSYLGSPWYWPKVWSYNPEVENPHLIYPGNQVRLFPAGEGMPQQVAPVAQAQPEAGADEDAVQGDALPSDLVSAAGPLVYRQGAPTYPLASEGFVSREEIDGAGSIEGAATGALMLSFGDQVYVSFRDRNDARVGERYQIFRPGDVVKEPTSGRTLGHLTHIVGELVVTDVSADLVTGRIDNSLDEIRRGDRVGPAGEATMSTIRPRPNQVELTGRVARGMEPVRHYGEHHKLIIDKGGRVGVEVGNQMRIVRRGDPKDHFINPAQMDDERFPQRVIGQCIVVDVREEASICLLTSSLLEILPGDRVEMRAEQAPTASR